MRMIVTMILKLAKDKDVELNKKLYLRDKIIKAMTALAHY